MGLLGLALYALRNMTDYLRPLETRVVRIPAAFVAKLQAQAQLDLGPGAGGGGDPRATPFVSTGDVLCAWWTKLVTAPFLRARSRRTVVVVHAMELRDLLGRDLLPGCGRRRAGAGACFLSNAVAFVHVLLPARDVLAALLGVTALAFRTAVAALGTRAQTEGFAAAWRSNTGRMPPLFGDARMHLVTFSNWTKANLYETDFSAAVVDAAGRRGHRGARGAAGPGRPVYIQNSQLGLLLPNAFPIIGKDGSGNFWLSGYLKRGVWARLEQELAQLEAGPLVGGASMS